MGLHFHRWHLKGVDESSGKDFTIHTYVCRCGFFKNKIIEAKTDSGCPNHRKGKLCTDDYHLTPIN